MKVWTGSGSLCIDGKIVGTVTEITLTDSADIERARDISRTTAMSFTEALDLLKAARAVQDKLAQTAEQFESTFAFACFEELQRREAYHHKVLAQAAVEHQRGAQWKNEPKAYGPKRRR